jgi:preprotein translocase SecE subunit
VARDRQRAKQRRRAKRRPGAGGPAAGSASTRARDIGLDEAEADDAGLGSTIPPEPTKHGMPDVEAARIAESGAPVPGPNEDELDVYSAPDEVEGDVVLPDREVDPAIAEERAARRGGRPQRRRGRALTFLGHSVDELRRVQWPDRRHVGQGTAVVLGFVVIAGSYLGLLDAILKPLVDAIL